MDETTKCLMGIAADIGGIKKHAENTDAHLVGIGRDLNLVRHQLNTYGTRLELHEKDIANHTKKISYLLNKLDVVENTETMHIVEEKTRWKTILKAISAAIGILVLFGGPWIVLEKCSSSKTQLPTVQRSK